MPLSQVGEVDNEDFPSSLESGDNDPAEGLSDAADPPTTEAPPVHPIMTMQGAFEESILESTQPDDDVAGGLLPSSMRVIPSASGDLSGARARRRQMLEQDDYSSTASSRLPKKAGAKYHAFWKLAAQISFGIHLLHDQLAKSDDEVVKIMQAHVDEIDAFLERTTEDFDLAITDISERISFLKLPLEHIEIFEVMLADKKFCTSIVEGNGKIETIVNRTSRAMNESLLDIAKGIEATSELGKYLDTLGAQWSDENQEFLGIYTAMRGNTEGWYRCFRRLQLKGSSLGVLLVQLGSMLTEMSKRVGAAGRKGPFAARVGSSLERSHSGRSGRSGRSTSSAPTSRFSATAPNKPLPYTPSASRTTLQIPISRQSSTTSDRRFEQPRKQPRPPNPNGVAPANGHVRRADVRQDYTKPQTREGQQQQRHSASRTKEPRRSSTMESQQHVPRNDRSKPVSRRSSQRSERPRPVPSSNSRLAETNYHSSRDASEGKTILKKSNGRNKHASVVGSPNTVPDSGYWPGTSSGSGPNVKAAKTSIKSKKSLLRLGLFPSASNLSMISMPSAVSRSRMDSTQSSNLPAGVSGRSTPMTTSASSVLRKKPSFAALKRIFKRNQQPASTNPQANFME